MQFHGRERQFLSNGCVLNLASVFERHAADELGNVGARSNGGSAAKGLEFNVVDNAIVINSDLQLHNITARGGTNETSADIVIVLVHGANVPRVVVVIKDLGVVLTGLLHNRSAEHGISTGKHTSGKHFLKDKNG